MTTYTYCPHCEREQPALRIEVDTIFPYGYRKIAVSWEKLHCCVCRQVIPNESDDRYVYWLLFSLVEDKVGNRNEEKAK